MAEEPHRQARRNGITPVGRGQLADLYQLLAYMVASDLLGGLLVYGKGGVSAVHRVVPLGRRLEVASLDLAESPEGI